MQNDNDIIRIQIMGMCPGPSSYSNTPSTARVDTENQ